MALIFQEGVREVTKTSGVGAYELLGASPGSFTLASVMADGDTGYFDIDMPGGPGREIILGTFLAPNTLVRTTVINSSNSNLAVYWPGSGQRFIKMIRGNSASGSGLLPTGGDCKFALFKQSDANYDADWEGFPVVFDFFARGIPGGEISGSGTSGVLPLWSGGNTLGDSGISDNGTKVTISRRLNISDLPTSISGLSFGDIWANEDVLMVYAVRVLNINRVDLIFTTFAPELAYSFVNAVISSGDLVFSTSAPEVINSEVTVPPSGNLVFSGFALNVFP